MNLPRKGSLSNKRERERGERNLGTFSVSPERSVCTKARRTRRRHRTEVHNSHQSASNSGKRMSVKKSKRRGTGEIRFHEGGLKTRESQRKEKTRHNDRGTGSTACGLERKSPPGTFPAGKVKGGGEGVTLSLCLGGGLGINQLYSGFRKGKSQWKRLGRSLGRGWKGGGGEDEYVDRV